FAEQKRRLQPPARRARDSNRRAWGEAGDLLVHASDRDQLESGPGQETAHAHGACGPQSAPHAFGISFDGSKAGFGETTARTLPETGWSSSSSVPSSSSSTGNMANPMFFSSRGEKHDEVTRPTSRPPA